MPRFIEEKISELEIGDWKEKGHKNISTEGQLSNDY